MSMTIDIFTTEKKYNVIYADPPWKFGSKMRADFGNWGKFRSLDNIYPTVPTQIMSQWDVGRIAAQDCAILMWSTDAHIKEAIELMEAWGFRYVTIAFVWAKTSKNGKQISNLGAWTLKNCEICLLGTKGHMLKFKGRNNIKQLFYAERTVHSRKPDCVRTFIDDIFPRVPKIELFAREQHDGWDCWGNEV